MFEQHVVVSTRHGTMPAFAVCPDEAGQWPAVIFYMDAPGTRSELMHMARNIAKQGYYCLMPDLYYRLGTIRFDLPRREDTMSGVIRACVNHAVNIEQITDDTGAMLNFLDGQQQVTPGPVGAVGYCMGGPMITWAASRFPERIKGAASLYGIRMATEDSHSPHLEAAKVQGELYYGFAETDRAAPPETIEALRASLVAAGVKHQIEVLPGTEHGFCFPERGHYVPAAAELVWQRLFSLWDRTLKGR
ncbi:MAG TPA: dienelactone hydrolase family protein [Devosia sp.]|nr:dienelactone hydrolase family protein [Devosia sp.]